MDPRMDDMVRIRLHHCRRHQHLHHAPRSHNLDQPPRLGFQWLEDGRSVHCAQHISRAFEHACFSVHPMDRTSRGHAECPPRCHLSRRPRCHGATEPRLFYCLYKLLLRLDKPLYRFECRHPWRNMVLYRYVYKTKISRCQLRMLIQLQQDTKASSTWAKNPRIPESTYPEQRFGPFLPMDVSP